MSLIKAYVFLFCAVMVEIIALSLLKATLQEEYRNFGLLGMYILLVLSYFFMALCLKRLPISIAYAIWEALGGLCVTLIGIFYFNEELSFYQKCGILLALCGICLMNYAELRAHRRQR
ncbi:DMT family transporter [Helicobacter marmotae]|uniref:Spermidine export protein MdtJ n=1 Tax=Helicobacter marmotae TaxID=152490 RepID=A0A3D8I4A8_9HELI|nr:multidrug efflux SMR transporter [Helicobacter marmotae]RDU59361.1 QacE family quaternary ammonium compound efflux SMR transporter [Helicobacter marmotae]